MEEVRWRNVLGVILLLATFCLLCAVVCVLIYNDGEWGQVMRTRRPSVPVVWSPWQPNDGSVRAFPDYRSEQPTPGLVRFRHGPAYDWLFDFTWYEGQTAGDSPVIVPAYGPGWGTDYHWYWPAVTLVLGVVCLRSGRSPSRVSQ